jgi:hypothetical protein
MRSTGRAADPVPAEAAEARDVADILVPSAFLRMVHAQRVDVRRLRAELHGEVRTRTWPGTADGPLVLESLPDDFPRMRGAVSGGRLLIQTMYLRGDVRLSMTSRMVRLTMDMPDLPRTLLAALAGRALRDVVEHKAFGPDVTILRVDEVLSKAGSANLVLKLRMDWVPLDEGGDVRAARDPHERTHADALIGLTHEPIEGAIMPGEAMLDPRNWEEEGSRRVVGIVHAVSGPTEAPVFAVRFPYDADRVAAMGRGGFGAWFDRATYSWHVPDTASGRAGLSIFLERHADVVVGPDGRLHLSSER